MLRRGFEAVVTGLHNGGERTLEFVVSSAYTTRPKFWKRASGACTHPPPDFVACRYAAASPACMTRGQCVCPCMR
jgi:hypothetical protein